MNRSQLRQDFVEVERASLKCRGPEHMQSNLIEPAVKSDFAFWLAHAVPSLPGLRNLSATRDSHLIQTAVLLRVEAATKRQLS